MREAVAIVGLVSHCKARVRAATIIPTSKKATRYQGSTFMEVIESTVKVKIQSRYSLPAAHATCTYHQALSPAVVFACLGFGVFTIHHGRVNTPYVVILGVDPDAPCRPLLLQYLISLS